MLDIREDLQTGQSRTQPPTRQAKEAQSLFAGRATAGIVAPSTNSAKAEDQNSDEYASDHHEETERSKKTPPSKKATQGKGVADSPRLSKKNLLAELDK